MSPSTLVAGAVIKVNGADLDPKYADVLAEVRVTQSLNLPDACVIRFQDDMKMTVIDAHPFDFGKTVQVLMQPPTGDQFTSVFKGEVVSVEGEFEEKGVYLNVRAYGQAHRLNRTKKNKTFLNQSYTDIAKALANEASLSVQASQDPGGTRKFVQQSNETAWEMLVRLARQIGFTVAEREGKLYFTQASDPLSGATRKLKWGQDLTSFRPRMTGVQQAGDVTVRGWDPDAAREITGQASSSSVKLGSTIGMKQSKTQTAFGSAAKIDVGDRLVSTQSEANALAKSVIERQSNAYLEATGTAVGHPELKSGDWLEVEGVGTRFGGKYLLSEVVHSYKAEKGFTTTVRITGQNARGIVDAVNPASRRDWGGSVVIGIVTNNNDPDGFGRVKLKFPSLGNDVESWWARIASTSAGADRGVLMLPQPNDEVLVAFEHGDVRRPYVIGSLWNGKAKPNNLVQKDGSYVLQSDKKIEQKAKDAISVKGDKEFTLDTTGAINQKTKDKLSIDATQGVNVKGMKIEINANADISINANAAITISAKGKLEVSATGMLKVGTAGVLQLSGSQIMLG